MTFLIACNVSRDKKHIREQLNGEWARIVEKNEFNDFLMDPFFLPDGMAISNDSIEFYLGFFKHNRDSITGEKTRTYFGNIVPYKIEKGRIFIKSPLTETWEFKWKFISRKNDTLELAVNDTTILKYKRIAYDLDTLPEFDQIIYSSSGCYGSCPIIDISLDKDGNILFQGEGYVKPLGFYSAKLDDKTRKYIFDKFRRADPIGLLDEYAVTSFHSESLITTFIKEGKIVKTIDDYGMVGPSELIWAYIPIANLYSSIQLDSLPLDESFYPDIYYSDFQRDGLILPLVQSESFYLWTELKKSKQTDKEVKPLYILTFMENYTYLDSDPNKGKLYKDELKSIKTDGQLFKFEFKGDKPITYDLGYNFIDENFKMTSFRKPEKWED